MLRQYLFEIQKQVQRNGLFGQDGMFSIRQDGRLPQG
jgi:hypothetical protein